MSTLCHDEQVMPYGIRQTPPSLRNLRFRAVDADVFTGMEMYFPEQEGAKRGGNDFNTVGALFYYLFCRPIRNNQKQPMKLFLSSFSNSLSFKE